MPLRTTHTEQLTFCRGTVGPAGLTLPSSAVWLSRQSLRSPRCIQTQSSTNAAHVGQTSSGSVQGAGRVSGKGPTHIKPVTSDGYSSGNGTCNVHQPGQTGSPADSTVTQDTPHPATELNRWEEQFQGRKQKRTVMMPVLPGGDVDLQQVRGCVLDSQGNRMLCPCCEGAGFVKSAVEVETCPVCRQWPEGGPLRQLAEYEDDVETGETMADIKAWRQAAKSRRAGRAVSEEREKRTGAANSSKPGTLLKEATDRRIESEMRRLAKSEEHRQRISDSLRGKPKICSLCGEEGHNKRGCPNAEAIQNGVPPAEAVSGKGRTKKIAYAEVLALREKRREERRDRPKSAYKGVSWDKKRSLWHVQLWTGSTTKSIGYWGDEEKAAREYDRAALEMRGPSAELNFPGEALPAGPKKPRKVATKEFVQLPMVSGEAVSLAVSAIVEAWKAGVRRQLVEYVLPINADSEVGVVKQEFKAARDLVEATLVQLKQVPELAGRISAQWLDKTDCVGAWQSEKLAAVLFCTSDCLPQLRNIDGGELSDRLTIVFNPQWQIGGQVVSDFGFGKSRREAEDFVQSFEEVFFMQRRRVMGDNIRIFKCYGSNWQVHYMWPNGKGQMLVSTQKEPPSYERLLSLLRKVPGSKSARSWVERVLRPDWITGDGGLDLPPADLSPGQPAPSTQAGRDVVHGAGTEAAQVQAAGRAGSEPGESLRSRLASLSASPVTSPRDSNPVDSARSLAAAAGSDAGALDLLDSPTAASGGQIKGEESASDARKRRAAAAKSRRPDRLADAEAARDLRLDPVLNIPTWQRQVFGNAFGRDRDDSSSSKLSGLAARKAMLSQAQQESAERQRELQKKQQKE